MYKFLFLSILLAGVEASFNASSDFVFKELKTLDGNYFSQFNQNGSEALIGCGGVVKCNDLNHIIYQPFASLQKGLRCVWEISMPNTQHYWIKLEFLGIKRVTEGSEKHAGLILTAVRLDSEHLQSYDLDVPDVSLAVQADVLILTLWTKAETFSNIRKLSDTGFILNFQPKQKSVTPTSIPLITTQKIVLPGTNTITHSDNAAKTEERASQELSIYVLAPLANILDNTVANVSKLNLSYKKQSTVHDYSCDIEKIVVYEFQRKNNTLIPNYIQKKIVCDDDDLASVKLNDLGLLVVKNKARNILKHWQFELQWTN